MSLDNYNLKITNEPLISKKFSCIEKFFNCSFQAAKPQKWLTYPVLIFLIFNF